ncbi:hypothetical protein AAFP30_25330 [Gordonia sp. CPCC 205515]|uniref:hypothetical protein n=1 Tax=Gordonia sp. CPCC 205515 TaxID=3140791 RepID=UPI003AF3BD5A
MKSVVMECRILVCASPRRINQFVRHAKCIAAQFSSGRIRHSFSMVPVTSPMLRSRWGYDNGPDTIPGPDTCDVSLAFSGPPGQLTAAQLDTVARDVLADLEPHPGKFTAEIIPWILTLTTETDEFSRRALTKRHPGIAEDTRRLTEQR